MITFTAYGKPVGKERPRVERGHARTPARTHKYEKSIKLAAQDAGVTVIDGDVSVHVQAFFEGAQYPDLDNVVKAVLDALNGIAYRDDKQVADIAIKRGQGTPRTEVTISAIQRAAL